MTFLVSIIIPTYNREKLIGETLDSVLAQTYQNWECIVVDDGSTDATKKIVDHYILQTTNFKYLRNFKTKGGQGARNSGLEKAQGEFIMFLDSDDLMEKKCLEKRIHHFTEHKEKDFLVFQSILLNYRNKKKEFVFNLLCKKEDDISRFIKYDYPWNISSILLRVNFLKKKKIEWNEDLKIHQDLDFNLSLLCQKPLYAKIIDQPDVLIRMDNQDKLSKPQYTAIALQGKYDYLESIFRRLKSAGILSNFKRELYGLALSYMMLFARKNEKKLYARIPVLFSSFGFYILAFSLVPDELYFRFRSKYYNKTFRRIIDFYRLGKLNNRTEYLPPKGSTLGKIDVSQHLKNTC